jgi:hypothetical protein
MTAYTEQIRQIARRLLKECQVEMIIGFRAGSMPMMNEPCFIRKPEDADKLVWDGNCGINLANYLTDRKEEKIGVLAKGCDSRNIVTHIIENKIKREQLVIIGIPCQGMIDKRSIAMQTEGEIIKVTESEDQVLVQSTTAIKALPGPMYCSPTAASASSEIRSSMMKWLPSPCRNKPTWIRFPMFA